MGHHLNYIKSFAFFTSYKGRIMANTSKTLAFYYVEKQDINGKERSFSEPIVSLSFSISALQLSNSSNISVLSANRISDHQEIPLPPNTHKHSYTRRRINSMKTQMNEIALDATLLQANK